VTKVLVGDIKGPTGDTGATGAAGATGTNALYNTESASYVPQAGAVNYVGATDPGAVPDGCIWFDTS
jgi:hypothetical protein